MEINIGISSILTALEDNTVGTKVNGKGSFLQFLETAIRELDPEWPGKGVISLPTDAYPLVRGGVASLEGLEKEDLHIKKHRGEWQLFALPRHAVKISSLSCVVYGINEYLNDPEVTKAEGDALKAEDVTHVLVAVLAGHGALSSHRLVRNLAGGNRSFMPTTDLNEKDELCIGDRTELHAGELADDVLKFHKIIGLAKDTVLSEKNWIVVADPDED